VGVLQSDEMRGEVALGQRGDALQVGEIGPLTCREGGEHRQPGGLMNEFVQPCDLTEGVGRISGVVRVLRGAIVAGHAEARRCPSVRLSTRCDHVAIMAIPRLTATSSSSVSDSGCVPVPSHAPSGKTPRTSPITPTVRNAGRSGLRNTATPIAITETMIISELTTNSLPVADRISLTMNRATRVTMNTAVEHLPGCRCGTRSP